MKEFIDKLKSRLKEKLLEYINKANDEMIEKGHTLDFENFLGHKEAYENVLYEIVNQLAEEYKDCSECSRRSWYQKGYADAENHYIQVIDGQHNLIEETKNNNGWIPCSERLPEEYCEVLVTVKHFEYAQTGFLKGGVWYADDNIKYLADSIIAWQPLPQPYKGESNYNG